MAKGKYLKKFHLRRTTMLVASLVLLLSLSVGGILAWLSATDEPIANIFTPSEVTTEVTEERSGNLKKNVQIKNTGDTTAWIRAAVVVTWQNEAGEVYGKAPAYGVDYTAWTPGNGWIEGNDHFFYYTSPVKSDDEDPLNCTTGVLISQISPVVDRNPEGYYLNVEIIGSGIQYKPAHVFNDNWGISSGLSADTECTGLTKTN